MFVMLNTGVPPILESGIVRILVGDLLLGKEPLLPIAWVKQPARCPVHRKWSNDAIGHAQTQSIGHFEQFAKPFRLGHPQRSPARLQAVHNALKNSYDLVLMDLQMPVMDGYEAMRSLRKAGFNRSDIALTAHAMEEDRARKRATGCKWVFDKTH